MSKICRAIGIIGLTIWFAIAIFNACYVVAADATIRHGEDYSFSFLPNENFAVPLLQPTKHEITTTDDLVHFMQAMKNEEVFLQRTINWVQIDAWNDEQLEIKERIYPFFLYRISSLTNNWWGEDLQRFNRLRKGFDGVVILSFLTPPDSFQMKVERAIGIEGKIITGNLVYRKIRETNIEVLTDIIVLGRVALDGEE